MGIPTTFIPDTYLSLIPLTIFKFSYSIVIAIQKFINETLLCIIRSFVHRCLGQSDLLHFVVAVSYICEKLECLKLKFGTFVIDVASPRIIRLLSVILCLQLEIANLEIEKKNYNKCQIFLRNSKRRYTLFITVQKIEKLCDYVKLGHSVFKIFGNLFNSL